MVVVYLDALLRYIDPHSDAPDERETSVDASWLRPVLEAGRDNTDTAVLAAAITKLSELLAKGKFDEVGLILETLDISRISPEAMVTFARTPFRARTKIASWESFVKKVAQEMQSRGFDGSRAVAGLLG